MKLKDFLQEHGTRSPHNEGSKLEIGDDAFLVVLGPDSDIGREVAAERYRITSKDDVAAKLRRLFAKLIKDWSFEEPVTVDLVEELFTEYPFVYDQVVTFYSSRANFTKSRSGNSTSMQNLKSA